MLSTLECVLIRPIAEAKPTKSAVFPSCSAADAHVHTSAHAGHKKNNKKCV